MSPEALRARKFSEKSDVFSFGVTMWEIIQGQRPWAGRDSMDVVFRVCSGERMPLPKCEYDSIPKLIERCWQSNPDNRPKMDEVLNILHTAWIETGGLSSNDASGGIAAIISSEAFVRANLTESTPEKFLAGSSSRAIEPPSYSFDQKLAEDSKGYVEFHG